MAIIKNEIPILEFDTEQTAVLNPTHENLGLNLPKKCVFAFLGAYGRKAALFLQRAILVYDHRKLDGVLHLVANGRKYSLWYLLRSVPRVPAHLLVVHRLLTNCLCKCVLMSGSGSFQILSSAS